MTSAPRSANSMVTYGPAHTVVRSSTRTPRNGNWALDDQTRRPDRPSLPVGILPFRDEVGVLLPERWRQPAQAPPPFPEPVGRAGQIDRSDERIVGMNPEPPLAEVVRLQNLGGRN